MPEFEIACPTCGERFTADESHIGQVAECDQCGAEFVVRMSEKEESPPVVHSADDRPDNLDSAATMFAPHGEDPANLTAAEDNVPRHWQVDDVILDLYEVTEFLGEGSFGDVHKVHHRNWKIDLAVKTPKRGRFTDTSEDEKEVAFIAECERWIDLGLHPNIVACHYVRRLGSVPRVFAEYVDGGSLEDWIGDKRLYEGDHAKALERMLDVAVQFAWGLRFAHDKGLVHQDIKPANLMMTADGRPKLADFGLGHGGTPAYWSPEQARIAELKQEAIPKEEWPELTPATDIWSWGLCILEMFSGDRTWTSGTVASEVLEVFLQMEPEDESIPKMPDGLPDLLRHCFQDEPADRPEDMGEIAEKLKEIHRGATGEAYPIEEPKAAELLADSLNNRALSFLDIGRMDAAEAAWVDALESDPLHLGSTFNLGMVQWQNGQLPDDQFVGRLRNVYDNSKDKEALFLQARVHVMRRCPSDALSMLDSLNWENSPPTPSAAEPWNVRGVALVGTGDLKKAEGCFRQAATFAPSELGYLLNTAYAVIQQGGSLQSDLWRLLESNSDHIGRLFLLPNATDVSMWLREWRTDAILEGNTLGAIPSSVWGVAFGADGRLAFSAGREVLDNKTDVYKKGGGIIGWWTSEKDGDPDLTGFNLSSVANVSSSHDGTIVLSACDRRLVMLHSRSVLAMEKQVGHVAVSPAGSQVAVCFSSGGGIVTELSGKHATQSFRCDGLCCAAFSPDGALLAIGHEGSLVGRDTVIDVYRAENLELVYKCGGPIPAHSVVWIDDDMLAIADRLTSDIRIVHPSSNEVTQDLSGHSKGVMSLAVLREGRFLLSGGLDGTVRLWDVLKRRCDTTWSVGRAVHCVAVSSDGKRIAAGGIGGESGSVGLLRVWSVSLASANRRPYLNRSALVLSRPSVSSEVMIRRNRIRDVMRKVETMGSVPVERAEGLRLLRNAQLESGFERDLAVLAQIRRCAEGSRPTRLRQAWDRRRVSTRRPVELACIDPTARMIAITKVMGKGTILDVSSGEHSELSTAEFTGVKRAIAFSGDGRTLVMTSEYGSTLSFVSLDTGRRYNTVDLSAVGIEKYVKGISFSPDMRRMIVCCGGATATDPAQGMVAILDVKSNAVLLRIAYEQHFTNAGVISADGRIAAAASNFTTGGDNYIRVYDVDQGAEIRQFGAFSMAPSCVGMTPDGQFVAAGSFDGTAEVWCIPTGQMVRGPLTHGSQVFCVDLSADGRFCLTGGRDNAVRLWEVQSGRCLQILRGHGDAVKRVAFTPDLFQILSVDALGTVIVWEIDWEYALEPGEDAVEEPPPSTPRKSAAFRGEKTALGVAVSPNVDHVVIHGSPLGAVKLGQDFAAREASENAPASCESKTPDSSTELQRLTDAVRSLSRGSDDSGASFDGLFTYLGHDDPAIRSEAAALLARSPTALQHVVAAYQQWVQSDPQRASLIGRVLGRKMAKRPEDIVPGQVVQMLYGLPVSFIPCVCGHCSHLNPGIAVPQNGAMIAFYGQSDDKGAYAVPVLCDKCSNWFFVVWDTDPR